MPFGRHITGLTLAVLGLLIATGCGLVERVSDERTDDLQVRLSQRAESTVARLGNLDPREIEVVFSGETTLRQLHQVGITIGSGEIDCDEPLHIVVMEGMFDRDNLFESAVRIAGGTEAGIAMRLVAEIYDPEREMPLGMIGDSTGNHLGQISGGSFAAGGAHGELVLNGTTDTSSGNLVPESLCR